MLTSEISMVSSLARTPFGSKRRFPIHKNVILTFSLTPPTLTDAKAQAIKETILKRKILQRVKADRDQQDPESKSVEEEEEAEEGSFF